VCECGVVWASAFVALLYVAAVFICLVLEAVTCSVSAFLVSCL